MIILKCLNKKDLKEFLVSGKYESFDFLPITKHRGLSQTENLKADENDILLTLAFENEKLAGYLGTFPDEFILGNERVKYAWLSTLYVSENFRGKKIAQKLLDRVFEEYNGKIAITEFTKEAESLYNKTKKFQYLFPKNGKRYYFRTDFAELIPKKKPELLFLKPIFKVTDFFANSLIYLKNLLEKTERVSFEIKNFVDEESSEFLADFFKIRTPEELNIIIKNPWILEKNNSEKKYLFSSYSKEFKYFWVKIFDENQNLQTCALLELRNQYLKIPYLYGEDGLDDFVKFLNQFIKEKKIKALTSYQTGLNKKLSSKKFVKIHQKNFERRYLFHNDLVNIFPENFNPHYQDGDGDCVFT